MKRNYVYNLILSLTNILFPIISFPYASRVLGPAGIGEVQFVVSFAQYFCLVASLGIPVYGIQQIAAARKNPDTLSRAFSELTAISFVTSGILSVLYLVIIFSFPYFFEDINFFLFGGVIILFNFTAIDWFYSGIEEFKTLAIRSITIKLLSLILLFLFVTTEDDRLNYLLIVLFTIQGSHFVNVLFATGRVRLTFSGLDLRRHFKPLLFIFSTTVAGSMYTILDTVLLGFLADDVSVGYYTAAVKLNRITLPFVTSLGVVLIPQVASALAEERRQDVEALVNKTFHFLALFTVPVGLGLAVLAPEFIEIFSGQRFLPATSSMQILALLPLLVGLGHLFVFVILVPAGYHREAFYSMSMGVVVCFVLNFLLVPTLADRGAAIANVCTELVVTSAYFFYIRRHFTLTFRWSLFARSSLAAISFFPIVAFIRSWELPFVLSLSISVAACAVFYLTLQWLIFRNSLIAETLISWKRKYPGR